MLAVEWSQGIEDAWSDVASFVPKLIGAVVVFVIGWFVARFIRRVLETVLQKIRFDDAVDRAGIGAPLERAGFADSGKLLARIIYYGVMLIVLQLAVDVFGDSEINDALDGMIAFIPKLFVAIVIVVITGVVANVVRSFVAPAVSHMSAGDFITKAAFVAIWVIGGFAAVNQLEVAEDVVDTLFQTITYSLGLIFVIKFGVGGIWAARDRFWPAVYDTVSSEKTSSTTSPVNPTREG